MDEWVFRDLIGRAIRGWIADQDVTSLDDGDVMTLAINISETLRQNTDLDINRPVGSHDGKLTDFGQPPICY